MAITYGLTIDALNELNGFEPGTLLQVGQEIIIGHESPAETIVETPVAAADTQSESGEVELTADATLPPTAAPPTATATPSATSTIQPLETPEPGPQALSQTQSDSQSRTIAPASPEKSTTGAVMPIALGMIGLLALGCLAWFYFRK